MNSRRFAIGYVYSFFAAGVFHWLFNRFFPHTESIMDHPDLGEEIIAENDAKNVEKKRADRAAKGTSFLKRIFEV